MGHVYGKFLDVASEICDNSFIDSFFRNDAKFKVGSGWAYG
jgi:hypothetical protein